MAENQCLGGTASCINLAETLKTHLKDCVKDSKSNLVWSDEYSAAFSIAMSGSEARLFISWKHSELDYYMAEFDNFILRRPKEFITFSQLYSQYP